MAVVRDSATPAFPIFAPSAREDVWAAIARSYAAFSSPFVPSGEDIRLYERVAARHSASNSRKCYRVLMLGVTPGIAQMRWPDRTRLLAVEASPMVIRALWPGDVPGVRMVQCASWFELPWSTDSYDLIVGDGVLNVCRFPDEIDKLGRLLSKALASRGALAMRCYIPARCTESIESVFDALFSTGGLSVDAFKMRLYLAMQRSPEEGVAVRDAARVLEAFGVDRRIMKSRLRWNEAVIEPFAKWRDSDVTYSFAPLERLRCVLGRYFDETSVTYPGYEFGHCCPLLVLRPRSCERDEPIGPAAA